MSGEHYSYFNSILELFTVFNFAFIVSDTFNKELRGKIIGSFDSLSHSIKENQKMIDSSQDSLITIKNKVDTGVLDVNIGVVNALRDRLNIIEHNFKELADNIEIEIKRNSLAEGFSEICLFTGTYTLFILLFISINATTEKHITSFNEIFFVINFSSLLYLILSLAKEKFPMLKVWLKNRYRTSLLAIFSLTILGAFSWFIIFLIPHKHCDNKFLIGINCILMLTVPILHFVYYFIVAIRNSIQVSNNLNKRLKDEFEIPFDNFNREQLDPLVKYGKLIIENGD